VGAVVVLALVAAGPTLVDRLGKQTTGPALSTVGRETFPVVAVASGSLVPASQIALNFQLSGQVTEIDVSVGDQVVAGQVIARIDSSTQQADVQAAQAAVNSAEQAVAASSGPDTTELHALQAAVNSAKTALDQTTNQVAQTLAADRSRLASDQNAWNTDGCQSSPQPNPTQCQRDQQQINSDNAQLAQDQSNGNQSLAAERTQLTIAEDNLSSAGTNGVALADAQTLLANAQAQLGRAEADAAKTALTAPADGTVLAINGQVGETVQPGETTTPSLPGANGPVPGAANTTMSTSFAVLGDGNAFQVAAPFGEAAVVGLSTGETGTVSFDALPGLSIPGRVAAVATIATSVNGVSEYYAAISLDSSDPRLRIGMTATVSIDIAHATNVLAVPNQALYSLNGGLYVDVWYQKHAVPTLVHTGLIGDTLTEVTSGLSGGEQVVLSTQYPNALPTVAPGPYVQTSS
jgi:multidrug efflux pump subunit AcrA (membrane-fusion protein)